MKKTITLPILALFVIASIAMVSASTVIAGKIYNGPNFETAGPVVDANINVTCNGNVLYTTSRADGTYSVSYNNTANCPNDSIVTVWAEKGGITNHGTGKVNDYTAIVADLYIGVVNIALIPEFGLFIGTLTLASAVGIFFLVRRK